MSRAIPRSTSDKLQHAMRISVGSLSFSFLRGAHSHQALVRPSMVTEASKAYVHPEPKAPNLDKQDGTGRNLSLTRTIQELSSHHTRPYRPHIVAHRINIACSSPTSTAASRPAFDPLVIVTVVVPVSSRPISPVRTPIGAATLL